MINMKSTITTLLICFTLISIKAQSFCLNFENANIVAEGKELQVDIVISSDSDFLLGSSNLQFSFDNTVIENPTFVSSDLGIPFYQVPTVTEPVLGEEGSFNIEQAFEGFGFTVPTGGLNIGRIAFDIVDAAALTDLNWSYNGTTTETIVFDDVVPIFAAADDNTCLMPLENVVFPMSLKSFSAEVINNKNTNLNHYKAREAIDFSLEVFPNPTRDFIQIEITGIDNTNTERPMLEVYNNGGKLVRSIQLDSDLGRVDMTDMPSMLYHFMISYDGQGYPLRVMKIE